VAYNFHKQLIINFQKRIKMERLKNKTAIITGGAGGIGKAAAKLFANEGANVMLVDLNEEDLQKAVEEIGTPNIKYVVADVSKNDEVVNFVKKTKESFGEIDVFFNNAGIEGKVKPITEYPLEVFQKVMDVNVKGVWLGLKHVIPAMRNNGSIIITSSVAGMQGTANVSPYVASKHAIVGIMRCAALECAPRNIRVNTINPSPVDNRMMRSLEEGFDPKNKEEAKKQFEKMIPLGRYAKSEEIARVALFLASAESNFVTGAVLPVDGGMTA
jgi:NAD(P)-dependent dehydrogenase (short-subunit alcohol dehydrogenase family)